MSDDTTLEQKIVEVFRRESTNPDNAYVEADAGELLSGLLAVMEPGAPTEYEYQALFRQRHYCAPDSWWSRDAGQTVGWTAWGEWHVLTTARAAGRPYRKLSSLKGVITAQRPWGGYQSETEYRIQRRAVPTEWEDVPND